MIAATEGHLDIVKRLVEGGAAIQARNASGKTALDLARKGKHRRVVEYLDSRPRKPASGQIRPPLRRSRTQHCVKPAGKLLLEGRAAQP
jgi:hypothetical protein